MSVEAFENFYFSKQFLISQQDLSLVQEKPYLTHWEKRSVAGVLFVFFHPKLTVSHAVADQCEIFCLGDLLDPQNTTAGNQKIVDELAAETAGFDELEARLSRMAGRWVVIARFGHALFLHHDAFGLKTVFQYTDRQNGMSYAASQPALLAHIFSLKRFPERDAEIKQTGAAEWPPYAYPYDDIVQLLPNHRLNLIDFSIERYWPKQDPPAIGLDDAAQEILFNVRQIVQAALHRRRCYIGLTAGYDSRFLVACTLPLKDHIQYFTFKYDKTPQYDLIIARRMARIWQLPYRTIEGKDLGADFMQVLDENSSHMCLEHTRKNAGITAQTVNEAHTSDDGFYLEGLTGEQLRCLFYKEGHRSFAITPGNLCRNRGFWYSPLAYHGFSKWIDTFPETNIEPLEILYWEYKMGIWASASLTCKEGLVDIMPPMNCRHVMTTGLGVQANHRAQPHALFRRMCSLVDERLLEVNFNTTEREMAVKKLTDTLPLPWRVKHRLGLT